LLPIGKSSHKVGGRPLIVLLRIPLRLIHRHITHNKCYATFREFSAAMRAFLRKEVQKNWHDYCDQVTGNFRVVTPTEVRIIA
jgi:hypothetical protein